MAGEWRPRTLCSIEGEGGDGGDGGAGGAGGAADLVGGAGGDDGAAAAAGGGEGAEPEWLEKFSAEGGDADNPSNRDWVKSLGVKDLDGLAKIARDNQKAVRDSGRIKVPGEGATPEEVTAYHKAIGVPEAVDGYVFVTPEGAELDNDLVTPLRDAALKAGVPAAGFKALAEEVIKVQMDQLAALKTAEDGDAQAALKSWGDQKDAKLAAVNNAMRALDLTANDVAAIQRGFSLQGKPGSARVLNLLARLGDGMAEDALLGGDGKRRFGITGAEAQAEIDKLTVDQEFGQKLIAKDPAAVERWNRLNAAVAHDRDLKTRQAAAA